MSSRGKLLCALALANRQTHETASENRLQNNVDSKPLAQLTSEVLEERTNSSVIGNETPILALEEIKENVPSSSCSDSLNPKYIWQSPVFQEVENVIIEEIKDINDLVPVVEQQMERNDGVLTNDHDVNTFTDLEPYVLEQSNVVDSFVFKETNSIIKVPVAEQQIPINVATDEYSDHLPSNEAQVVPVDIQEVNLSDHIDNSAEDPDFVPGTSEQTDDDVSSSSEDPDSEPNNNSNKNSNVNTSNNEEEKQKTRKRLRMENTWKKNIKKYKINTGQEYTSRLGKVHKAKMVKPPCGPSCIYKCAEKIPHDKRLLIFEKFYNLADKTRQRDYIVLKCMRTVLPKIKINIPQGDTRQCRQKNHAYYFEVNDTEIRVCKLFFMATLDICNNTISTALKKTNDGFVEEEKRGKGQSGNKTPDSLIKCVEDHINSFPRVESHYCRARTEKQYIDGSLNLTLMYKFYKENCEKENQSFVEEHIYRKIFNTHFNISFFQPKKDQCSLCVSYEKYSCENEKLLKKKEYDTHKENVRNSRLEKEKDKHDAMLQEDTILATFDLQAVMPLPNGNISTFFYKSKLNIYNFTVYNIKSKEGFCYLWNESIAKRGAIEIATCVYNFLKDHCQGKKEVIFYSDNCVAQNKNKFMFSMYLYALKKLNIQKITHKYLIIGHTENEGDSIHSCIEREKKRILKQGPIFVPSEVAMIIKCAKKKDPMYSLMEMETKDFIDWKKVCEQTGKNFNINTDNEKCHWNNVKMIQVSITDPDLIRYKTSYSEILYSKSINVRYRMRGRRNEAITVTSAYSEPPRIPANKLKDLISLCTSRAIPERHHQFFQNLKGQEDKAFTEEEDDEGALQ